MLPRRIPLNIVIYIADRIPLLSPLSTRILMEGHQVPERVQAPNQVSSNEFLLTKHYVNTGKRKRINKVKLQTKKQL